VDVLVLVTLAVGCAAARAAMWPADPSAAADAQAGAATPPHPTGADGRIETVGLDETRAAVEAGDFLIFDARPRDAYAHGHLPGAMPLPRRDAAEAIADYLPLLAPDQPVLVYCSSQRCRDAWHVARIIEQHGVASVAVYEGGFAGWRDAGLAIETGD